MDKKKKALLITAGIAAVLLAAALLLSRPQPLGELLHTSRRFVRSSPSPPPFRPKTVKRAACATILPSLTAKRDRLCSMR